MIIQGKYGEAIVYTDDVEQEAIDQIVTLMNQPMAKGAHVRIMPDVHAGAGCVIGYTAKLTDKVVPNLIGVDIGCGVLAVRLHRPIDNTALPLLDMTVRAHVPLGFNIHKKTVYEDIKMNEREQDDIVNICRKTKQDESAVMRSLGTLGGGNHFIELASDSTEQQWLVIHSGSRNFGFQVANYYQKIAHALHPEAPKALAWLEGKEKEAYLQAMRIAQRYAQINRLTIASIILRRFFGGPSDLSEYEHIESVHNYIAIEEGIIRKGAIAAKRGSRLIIALNMRDGSIIGIGKGNPEWNYSAPHGAGRALSRSSAKKQLSLAEFKKQMEGIYSTSIHPSTLDEAPMAYKKSYEIIKCVEPVVEIETVLHPLWNLKG